VVNHSPTGLSWGYGGSGPCQLALALLCDAIGKERALAIYQEFKEEQVAKWSPTKDWGMSRFQLSSMAESIEYRKLAREYYASRPAADTTASL